MVPIKVLEARHIETPLRHQTLVCTVYPKT